MQAALITKLAVDLDDAPLCEPCAVLAAPRLPSRQRIYADAVREAPS